MITSGVIIAALGVLGTLLVWLTRAKPNTDPTQAEIDKINASLKDAPAPKS